jgi:hypothetical protein
MHHSFRYCAIAFQRERRSSVPRDCVFMGCVGPQHSSTARLIVQLATQVMAQQTRGSEVKQVSLLPGFVQKYRLVMARGIPTTAPRPFAFSSLERP